jgi:hypothetical protein
MRATFGSPALECRRHILDRAFEICVGSFARQEIEEMLSQGFIVCRFHFDRLSQWLS